MPMALPSMHEHMNHIHCSREADTSFARGKVVGLRFFMGIKHMCLWMLLFLLSMLECSQMTKVS